ncbi:MAG: YicC family protein [Bryobacteraceae bacterium]|nr:YicC family protein [Bryobacteraceae bacterium]MDW8377443.1 YicC/YloC family endoribonuclease [Bryobacterales bacterium]
MAGLRSMTGFARLRQVSERGEIVITLKGVNHRALDVHMHIPQEVNLYENTLRNVIKRKVARGHIDVRLHVHYSSAASVVALNEPLFQSYLQAFQRASALAACPLPCDVNQALRLPGMLSEADAEPDPVLEAELVAALEQAVDQFNASREQEGEALRLIILEANARIRRHARELAEIRKRILPAFQERLQQKLTSLLSNGSVDPQRIVQEAAILADRSDIEEEIQRLLIHSTQLEQILANGAEVGKKLDFLLQEMARETNTILSKTSGGGELALRITELGIAVKAEIEKIREQALNLE